MVAAGKQKTKRVEERSLQVRAYIRALLRIGPMASARACKTVAEEFNIDMQSARYHAATIGVIVEGNSNLTRLWRLPQDQQALAELEDSLPGGSHSCSRAGNRKSRVHPIGSGSS